MVFNVEEVLITDEFRMSLICNSGAGLVVSTWDELGNDETLGLWDINSQLISTNNWLIRRNWFSS